VDTTPAACPTGLSGDLRVLYELVCVLARVSPGTLQTSERVSGAKVAASGRMRRLTGMAKASRDKPHSTVAKSTGAAGSKGSRRGRPRTIAPTTKEDRRIAFRHLAELFAAAEGRGVALATEADDEAQRLVDEIAGRSLKHLRRQRLPQRDTMLRLLTEKIAPIFKASKANAASTLDDQARDIVAALAPLGLEPTTDELRTLAIRREPTPDDDLALNKRAGPGPRELAKQALARSLGIAPGTISTARRRPPAPFRLPFGRFLTQNATRGFVESLFANDADAPTSPPNLALRSVTDLEGTEGEQLDGHIQRRLMELLESSDWLVEICVRQSTDADANELREQFLERATQRCLFQLRMAAFLSAAPTDLRHELEQSGALPRETFSLADALTSRTSRPARRRWRFLPLPFKDTCLRKPNSTFRTWSRRPRQRVSSDRREWRTRSFACYTRSRLLRPPDAGMQIFSQRRDARYA
jgi:hypothetical protein